MKRNCSKKNYSSLVASLILFGWLVTIAFPARGEDQSAAKRPASKFALEVASFDQIQKEVAKHKGKVVVVDYWSSWCAPCVKELPEFAELNKVLAGTIVCLTVGVDFAGTEGETPEQHRKNLQDVLIKNGATMRGFLSSDPDLKVFEKLKVGSVPVLHVFDREGQLHKSFDNEKGAFGNDGYSIHKHVRPVVMELLK